MNPSTNLGFPAESIVGFSGSPRKGGNSDILLRCILKGAAEKGVPGSRHRLAEYRYDPCIGCEKCRKTKSCVGLKDGMTLLYPKLLASRGLVLTCPTHNYNVTAWMKAFIDRMYCFYDFTDDRPRRWSSRLAGQGRKAVIAAVCEQPQTEDMGFTIEAMRLPLEAMGYEIVGKLRVLNIFDRAGVKEEPSVIAKAMECGATLAHALQSA